MLNKLFFRSIFKTRFLCERFFVTGSIDLTTLRIPGVLQRLAISYLAVALIHLVTVKAVDSHEVSTLSYYFLYIFCFCVYYSIHEFVMNKRSIYIKTMNCTPNQHTKPIETRQKDMHSL